MLFAWVTKNIALIQIRPTLVPMSINAALGFLLSGLGLMLLNFRFFRMAQIFGALTFGLGGLTLLDFLLPLQIVSDLFISLEAPHFRPMAPTTALCFTLGGMAFLAVTNERLHNKGTLISGVLGAIIFCAGVYGIICTPHGSKPNGGVRSNYENGSAYSRRTWISWDRFNCSFLEKRTAESHWFSTMGCLFSSV